MEKQLIEKFEKLFVGILEKTKELEFESADLFDKGDDVDRWSVEKETQLKLRLKARDTVFINKVNRSLKKIHEGTFGECDDCGNEIGENRLLARPTADLCIHCKEEQEKFENQMIHKNRQSLKTTQKFVAPDTQSFWGRDDLKKPDPFYLPKTVNE